MKSFDTNGDFTQNYKFLIGSVQPRPIAWVSTCNEDGTHNLAPFSFFTAISAKPMIIAFCPLIRSSDEKKKDTLVNIERTGEFVVNFVTEANYLKVNESSRELAYGEDEFEFCGLGKLKSELVQPPRVKESPIHFECSKRDILHYGTGAAGSGSLITGEVLKVHIDDSLLIEGRINTDQFKPVGRGAGLDWYNSSSRFELPRLMKTQIQK